MNILMINQPLNNRGDESAHKALLRAVCKEKKNVRVTVLFIGANPDSIHQFDVHLPQVTYVNLSEMRGMGCLSKLGMIYNVRWIWHLHPMIFNIMKLYKESDVVLCAPGGICMGGFQNWWHLFMLQLAKYIGKPLVYYGRSFGPFPVVTRSNRQFKKLSVEMLHYFSFLSIRDKKSESLAQELGIRYVATVDSAFLDSPKLELPDEILSFIGHKPYVVFVPNQLNWHYAYRHVSDDSLLTFYSSIIDLLIKRYPSHNIVMLPQLFNAGGWCDYLFFEKIKGRNPNAPLVSISDKYNSDVQQTVIAGAQSVIGARYHSIVFAINNGVPFISLSYEHKMSGLLCSLGGEEMMVDIVDTFISSENMQATIELILSKINVICLDQKLRFKAQNMAQNSFDKFVRSIFSICG